MPKAYTSKLEDLAGFVKTCVACVCCMCRFSLRGQGQEL